MPSPATKRWVPRRKAVIVNAVRQGTISLEEVCRRYQLSVEEFLAWQRAMDTHGVPGLRSTRLQMIAILVLLRQRMRWTECLILTIVNLQTI